MAVNYWLCWLDKKVTVYNKLSNTLALDCTSALESFSLITLTRLVSSIVRKCLPLFHILLGLHLRARTGNGTKRETDPFLPLFELRLQ